MMQANSANSGCGLLIKDVVSALLADALDTFERMELLQDTANLQIAFSTGLECLTLRATGARTRDLSLVERVFLADHVAA